MFFSRSSLSLSASWAASQCSSASRRSASSRLGRAGTPLRLMAQHHATGQIPLAAAHAASGLHLLLGAIAASQDAVTQGNVDTLAAQAEQLEAAPEALETAIGNTDILLNMLKSVGL
ncbi:DUF6245 family protein [Streptomyces shenzhenensis]|uniref:DUF6245 family protein n=1 Tax=Streptomyces shenzhenensis TaxID=943815 RepID=UPI00286815CF|nr:DUF6245 family protein [Streptomyces shenzhenensis]